MERRFEAVEEPAVGAVQQVQMVEMGVVDRAEFDGRPGRDRMIADHRPRHPRGHRDAGAADKIQQLVMAFVHLTADLTAFGDSHQDELRLIPGPQHFSEFIIISRHLHNGQR